MLQNYCLSGTYGIVVPTLEQALSRMSGMRMSGKGNCFFWRNVTRCYAKNIIVQTFSVLLSHYYRITIALPSYTNTRVIQAICLVGVNYYPVTSKIFRFTGPLRKGLKSSTFALTFVSEGHTNAMRSDEDSLRSVEDSLRRHRTLLECTKALL